MSKPAATFADRDAVSSPGPLGLGAGIADIVSNAAMQSNMPQQRITQSTQQAQQTVVPPTPTRSYRGLPGLFMVGSDGPVFGLDQPQQSFVPFRQQASTPVIPQGQPTPSKVGLSTNTYSFSATHTDSPASLVVPRKRPVASDFDDIVAKPTIQPKRPFGQSRGASEDEGLIIEVSDDDSDEDEDDDIMETETSGPGDKPIMQTMHY